MNAISYQFNHSYYYVFADNADEFKSVSIDFYILLFHSKAKER